MWMASMADCLLVNRTFDEIALGEQASLSRRFGQQDLDSFAPITGDVNPAGTILAKQLSFLARADAASIVLGAQVAITLASRADSERTRLASCAVAVLLAHASQARGAKS
jgi:hypothetical protein